MYSRLGRKLRKSRCSMALPVVPIVTLATSETYEKAAGDALASQSLRPPDPPDKLLPLTYGKVFTAIPRLTKVNTPNINNKISQVWGLPRTVQD